jgi:nucleoside-diphosphate kinase
MRQQTLAIIKPDAVSKNLVGKIIERIEAEGIKIVAMKMIKMSKEQAKGFYHVHKGKPFYESLTDFMSSGPCVVMVLEGDDVINRYRRLMGTTDPAKAEPNTIRKEFGTDIEKNAVHGSDSPESAEFELRYFFSQLEIVR